MKKLKFIGTSLKDLKKFPQNVQADAGQELRRVQKGGNPLDWKPMKSIGVGVKEIRIKEKQGIYRVIYIVKYLDQISVLHAFHKER